MGFLAERQSRIPSILVLCVLSLYALTDSACPPIDFGRLCASTGEIDGPNLSGEWTLEVLAR